MLVPAELLVIDIEGVAAIATIAGAAAAARVVVAALLRLHDRHGGAEAKQARRLLSVVGRHAPPRHGGLQCAAASHGLSRTVWRDATRPPGRIEDGGKAGGVEDVAGSSPDKS